MLPFLTITHKIVSEKVDIFTDTMIEDIQDIIKVELNDECNFKQGILPPRYKELKEELKTIINNYLMDNISYDWLDNLNHQQHLE